MEGVQVKKKLPIIVMYAATSSDGMIARHSGELSVTWTSKEDQAHFREKMSASDVVVVGSKTYNTALQFLSQRNCIVFTRSVKTLERVSDKLLLCNPQDIPLRRLFDGCEMVSLIGGSEVYTYFLDRNLIDEIYLTTEPIFFGEGLPLFSHPVDLNVGFVLEGTRTLNLQGSVLRHYLKR